ncbi:helix-turn-helix domain-containing protein [Nonomuraea fuscirosea]|uniref:helix-turn-helix domain-containing protein n=1 Tax=Nonomuraea fuscirosea TaxID=1291556 RepID=UPI0037212FF6
MNSDLSTVQADPAIQAAAGAYAAGTSVREVARTHGRSVALLYREFRQAGVPLRGRVSAPVDRAEEIVAAYAEGMPMRQICARYGVAKSTVGRLVDAAGGQRRPSGKPRRVTWDEVEAAVRAGATAKEAAEQAGCSARQVARLLGKLGWAWDGRVWQPPR